MFEFNRQLTKYLNNARTQPKNTAKTISIQLKDSYHESQLHAFGKIIDTFEGVQSLNNMEQYFSNLQPTNALVHSRTLDQAAQLIAQQKGRQGKTQTSSPKMIYQKIKLFGRADGKIGQLVSLCATTPSQIATYFIIDDGMASRKRRRMVLDPVYRYVGVGHSAHSQYQFVTVILLAQKLEQNDNYFLQNSRVSQQMKRASQKLIEQGTSVQQQSNVRQSHFY